MLLERINAMLKAAEGDRPHFPPTVFFNENWLMRLAIDWFADNSAGEHPLGFRDKARWFSEALLPSAFLARHKGDLLAESWTHADGAIGHFEIGADAKGDLTLLGEAAQLTILEGKIFSRLSPGVRNARYFDQAARNVACIAEVLRRADRPPAQVATLGFYVLAPRSRIAEGVFAPEVTHESIRRKVQRRVRQYEGQRDQWYEQWFEPTLQHIEIACLSWEDIIAQITKTDPSGGKALTVFYAKCIRFNQPVGG